MKKAIFVATGLLVLVFTFAGCSKSNSKKQASTDHNLILNYATSHNLKGQFTSSGLYYVILDSGSANHPTSNAKLNVNYKGYFLDGTVFDQGIGFEFRLSQVIS